MSLKKKSDFLISKYLKFWQRMHKDISKLLSKQKKKYKLENFFRLACIVYKKTITWSIYFFLLIIVLKENKILLNLNFCLQNSLH